MKKKRIALVLDTWDYPYNGMVVSNKRFIKYLETDDFEFIIFALEDNTGLEHTIDKEHKKIAFKKLVLPLPFVNPILDKMRSPFAVPDKALLEQVLKDCDVLNVQYPFWLGAASITVAKKLGIPVVCSFHVQPENILRNIYIKSNFLVSLIYKGFNKLIYNRADMVIAPSAFAQSLLKKHGVHKPITVVSNGVPNEFFRQRPKACKTKGPYTLLSVGRFAKEKNQKMILEALKQSKFVDDIRVVLVGAGPQEESLREFAKQMPFEVEIGNVNQDRLMQLYDEADLFIHASEVELEGMSVLEAMASGMPVVVSNSEHSAAKDIVYDERSLFDFPNIDSLVSKIDYWLANPELREAAHIENARHARSYSHIASSKKMAKVLNQLLGADEKTVHHTSLSLEVGQGTAKKSVES